MVKVRNRKLKVSQTPCMIEVNSKGRQIIESQAFLESHDEKTLTIRSERLLQAHSAQDLKDCPITLMCMLGSARHCVVTGKIYNINTEQNIIKMRRE